MELANLIASRNPPGILRQINEVRTYTGIPVHDVGILASLDTDLIPALGFVQNRPGRNCKTEAIITVTTISPPPAAGAFRAQDVEMSITINPGRTGRKMLTVAI